MGYEIILSEGIFSSIYLPDWNLGDVCLTIGFAELIEHPSSDEELLIEVLKSHLKGDYGIVNIDSIDLKRANEARAEGRPFASIFKVSSEYVKVVTNPSIRRTVVCLLNED